MAEEPTLKLELEEGVDSESGLQVEFESEFEDAVEEELQIPVRPQLKETYALLLSEGEPCIAEVTELNEADETVTFQDTQSKQNHIFTLQQDELPLASNKILDIERVIPFDLNVLKQDITQLTKQLTSDIIKELDISLDEIVEKDIVYTKVQIQEELMSNLVESYDAYDHLTKLRSIQQTVNSLLTLMYSTEKDTVYLYNIQRDKPLPRWMIPLTDNPMKQHEPVERISDSYTELHNQPNISLNSVLNEQMQELRPTEPSLSERGYVTPHVSTYFRECFITDNCLGLQGNYRYDQRKNRQPYSRIFDGESELILTQDTLNITGLLTIPDTHLRFALPIQDLSMTMNEKVVLDYIASKHIATLKYAPVIQDTPEDSSSDINRLRLHQLPTRISETDEFYQIVETLVPSVEDIVKSVGLTLGRKLLNYGDFQAIACKYQIDPYQLSAKDILYLNRWIQKNVTTYLQKNQSLPKIVVKRTEPMLSLDQKIKYSLAKIRSMIDIPKRNEYLERYIQLFTREAFVNEDPQSLYNVYTNEPLLCKHYKYSSIYHRDPKAHQTMITVYGRVPEDGCIYCKHCGEYLCEEDFSQFDGFSDETPIMLREEIRDDSDPLESYKEKDISLVSYLGSVMGVKLRDADVALVLSLLGTINNDIIANKRYDTMEITTSDEHPRVKDILKKYAKDKKKNSLIAKETKQFLAYLKDTNKLVTLTTLLLLVIYTDIPGYNPKHTSQLFVFDTQEVHYNKKTIDSVILRLAKVSKPEPLWKHYSDLTKEHRVYPLPSIKEQILNLLDYFVSPLYPLLQERISHYRKYLQSIQSVYVNYEWALYKPLLQGKISKKVNAVLVDKDPEFKPYYILNYTNYPVENVSLLTPVAKEKPLYSLVGLKVSEIMVNQSFLRIFQLAMSNYGTFKGIYNVLDLAVERFIHTAHKQDQVKDIFKQHKWNSSLQSGKVSFKALRTKIIPDIIRLYLKTDGEIESCFTQQDICNEFIHININNYDVHLFKTKPKRVYQYIPFVVYPTGSYGDLSDEFKDALFAKYGKDPSGNVIQRKLSLDYLGKILLTTGIQVEDDYVRFYEQTMKAEASSVKEIFAAIQTPLQDSAYVAPRTYDTSDYKQIIDTTFSIDELAMYQVFRSNSQFDLDETHPLIEHLALFRELREISSEERRDRQRKLASSVSLLNPEPMIQTISELIATTTHPYLKKRYESIFVNTSTNVNLNDEDRNELEQDGFRYRNMRDTDIQQTLRVFLMGTAFESKTCLAYIYQLKYILSKLSSTQDTSTILPHPIEWNMKQYKDRYEMFSEYMENSSLNLHQDMFRKNPKYPGFSKYKQPCVFRALYDTVKPYLNQLSKLKFKQTEFTIELILYRYIFAFTLQKMISFYDRLKQEDEEVLSAINENLELYPQTETFSLPEAIDLTEQFIVDYLIHILESHYDSRWIVSNENESELKQRLSKQKEKEKQQLIQQLDQMSDEKRASTVELQKIGVVSMYHQAMAANQARVMNEYSMIEEDYDLSETAEEPMMGGEPVMGEEIPSEEGYYGVDDIDEDGQMGDELHEFHDEDLLDNEFNS